MDGISTLGFISRQIAPKWSSCTVWQQGKETAAVVDIWSCEHSNCKIIVQIIFKFYAHIGFIGLQALLSTVSVSMCLCVDYIYITYCGDQMFPTV